MSESSAERETAPPEEEAVSEVQADSGAQAGSGAQADSEPRAGSGAAATDEVPASAAGSGSRESGAADETEQPGTDQTALDHAGADQAGTDQASIDQAGNDQAGTARSDQQSRPAEPEPGRPEQTLPETLTFRITRTAVLAVISFTVCATPVASAQPWLLWIYLFPLAALVWVLRVRTTVSAEELRVRTLTGTTRVSWDEVQSVKLDSRRWIEAVLTSGKRVKLPAVRVRDLSRLSAMSHGRLPDPAR